MYYKLDEYDIKTLKEVEKKLNTKFENNNNLISVEELLCIIEDLMGEIDHWKDEYEDLSTYVDEYCIDTYNPYDEYGISQSDFI